MILLEIVKKSMIVSRIESQLGNQMFTYASTKCIALDCGYEYRYFIKDCYYAEKRLSNVDSKYGRNFDSIFKIPTNESVSDAKNCENEFSIDKMRIIKKNNESFYEEVYQIKDSTLMIGHFISCKYFEKRLDEVRSWFSFQDDIVQKNKEKIDNIRKNNNYLIAVHFRTNSDYRNYGYRLSYQYWDDAAKEYENKNINNYIFVVFYDQMTSFVKRFIKKHKSITLHGSLADDLCSFSMCDAAIVCNSTFSIWGGLLLKDINNVIRPSIYPSRNNTKMTTDCFYDSWKIVKAKQDIVSKICSTLMIGKILSRVRNVCYYKKISFNK